MTGAARLVLVAVGPRPTSQHNVSSPVCLVDETPEGVRHGRGARARGKQASTLPGLRRRTNVTNPAAPQDARVMGQHPVDFVLALIVAALATGLVLLDRLVTPAFTKMYDEFGSSAVLPLMTRALVAHVTPLVGAAGAMVLAVAGMFVRKRSGGRLAVGLFCGGIALALGAVGLSFYGLYAPIFDLAGKIQP